MKCVQRKGKIKGRPWLISRAIDEAAKELIDTGDFQYVAKRLWKEAGRP